MPSTNGAHVLSELKSALRKFLETREKKVLYLSHLPLTDEDARLLEEILGCGTVSIRSESATPASWRETAIAGVWWGEYRDESGRVALRTLEVADFPQLAAAQTEDIEEGRNKLEQLLTKAATA